MNITQVKTLPRDLERIASVAEPRLLPCLGTFEKRQENFQLQDEKETKTPEVDLPHPTPLTSTTIKCKKMRLHTSGIH